MKELLHPQLRAGYVSLTRTWRVLSVIIFVLMIIGTLTLYFTAPFLLVYGFADIVFSVFVWAVGEYYIRDLFTKMGKNLTTNLR